MVIKIKPTHWLHCMFQSLQLLYIILGWDRIEEKDIGPNSLFTLTSRFLQKMGWTLNMCSVPIWFFLYNDIISQYTVLFYTVSLFPFKIPNCFSLLSFFPSLYTLIVLRSHTATQDSCHGTKFVTLPSSYFVKVL